MKWVFSVLAMLLSFFLSCNITSKIKKEERELSELLKSVYMLGRDICDSLIPLPEAFKGCARMCHSSKEISKFYMSLSEQISDEQKTDFFTIWRVELDGLFKNYTFIKKDSLLELGHFLGKSGADGQKRAIEKCALLLGAELDALKENYEKYHKLINVSPVAITGVIVLLII